MVTVFGAYGHTGKFVVAELLKRGLTPVLAGRSREKLEKMGAQYPQLKTCIASTDNPRELDSALEGAAVVINCAGPFLDTAIPVLEAALRKGGHYLDIAAEQQSVIDVHEKFGAEAAEKGIAVVPAMAFYGGLGDLLATAAMGNWTTADAIAIGVALDSWLPTLGTRLTGQRNTAQRLTFAAHALAAVADPLPTRKWEFAAPFGVVDTQSFPLAEIITISKHLHVSDINTYINTAPLLDIHNVETPAPQPTDESGRSAQVFLMEAVVRKGKEVRLARASGRDIYAITAPLIVEAAVRIMEGAIEKTGVSSPGAIFDAVDFLRALSPEYLSVGIAGD